jgi:predicted GNAT superfamily acetyltransferase
VTAPAPAGVTIRPLAGPAELNAAVALQRDIWGRDFEEIVPAALLWAAQRVGGVATGAFDASGALNGLVFGLSGWSADGGTRTHWSDLLAVRADARGSGIGIALKGHQRRQLLGAAVESVGWTFDPLESRNAYINFARLGVTAGEYLRDVYGTSASPLHEGVGTDRLVAEWRIASERVARRMDAGEPAPAAAMFENAPAINRVRLGADGRPRSDPPDTGLDAPRLRLFVPAEIQRLKAEEPALGAEWRRHTRAAFERYIAAGYRVEELVRAGATSAYVLARAGLSR